LDTARRASETPGRSDTTAPLEERLRYKFQSTAVTERCTLLASRASI
jgi:hypothetical protein